jgi:diguanylate cyclase (GGDEF)-like protein/PAS domain S-box-containing protein
MAGGAVPVPIIRGMGGDHPAVTRPPVDAFELAGTGMAVIDSAGVVLRVNAAYCELVGRSEAELVGQSLVLAFPKSLQPLARRALKAAFAPGTLPMPSYWTLVRPDGRSIAALLTVRPAGPDDSLAVVTVTDVTTLAATEARLTAVLEESRLLLEHAQVGVLFVRTGRIMRANATCGRLFGCGERELVGEPAAAVLAPADGDTAAPAPLGAAWSGERLLRRRDGATFWCEIDVKPFGAPGAPEQAILTLRDVTARRLAQDELARMMLDQRALLDNASVGITFTRDRRVQRCNRRTEELFGYGPGELIGQPGVIFYPDAETYAALGREAGPVLARGEPFQTELQLRRKDGSLVWCRLLAKAINPEATGEGTIWIAEDISESRHTNESLGRLLRELSTIFDTASVGIAYTRDRVFLRCNRKHEELFGYGLGELEGQSTAVLFVDTASYEAFGARAAAVIASGETFETEVVNRRRDGSTILCHVSARAIDPADLSQGVIWIVQDVTAQRAAQQEIVRARDQLEQRVAERTHALARKNVELQSEIGERRLVEDELRVRSERLLYHRNQLLALARRDRSDFAQALRDVLDVACATLRLDRASFWRMSPDARALRCEAVYRADGGADAAPVPALLGADEHAEYFRAIAANEIVAAEDSGSHPATRSLDPVYMRPLGIASTLDVPVWLDGRVVGMVCLEAIAEARAWQPEEIDFASGVATMVTLAIEASHRRDAETRLVRLAHYDALTGLPNRNLLHDRLRQALAFAARHRTRVALMFLDLDRFKTINDSLGHHVGDRVLKEVSGRLTHTLRSGDTVARLGGDEFVVVLQEVREPNDAATVAQNLLRELAPPCFVDGRELHVSASVGITVFPDDGREADVLMKNADVAMYHVKESGRNGYQFFAATMNQQANRRLTIENELRRAIRRSELVLHYQPQFDIERRELRSLEALVRWIHPERGLVMPGGFIAIAEDGGLAQSLGEWTLREACLQSRRWQEAGIAPVPIAVNLSARAFRERSLPDTLRAILHDTGVDAHLLELEITESALMQHSETTASTLAELSAMGIQLAIDDFGTGYSSLAYLKRFPIDKLKIDRSFVREIPGNVDDAAITQAIISLARSLGLRVVAEGVETPAQLEFLRRNGCDGVQGHLFCPPCDPGETERLFGPAPLRRAV